MPDEKNTPGEEPGFEEAVDRLEALTEAMESGEIPLAELVAKYEEGNNLLKICQKRLRDAELKIEQLKPNRETEAFDIPASPGDE